MFWQKEEEKFQKGPALSCVHYGICSKEQCPLWVKLDSTVMVEGKPQVVKEEKCTFAWVPSLLIELRDHVVGVLKRAQTSPTPPSA